MATTTTDRLPFATASVFCAGARQDGLLPSPPTVLTARRN